MIGITAFDELATSAGNEFSSHGWTLVRYSPESAAWEETVVNQCKHVTREKRFTAATDGDFACDVCIMTALADTELEAVLRLPCNFENRVLPQDDSRYSEGHIVNNGRKIRIVAVAAAEMGNPASAILMTKVWPLATTSCIMSGICAGIDASVGDLAVAEIRVAL